MKYAFITDVAVDGNEFLDWLEQAMNHAESLIQFTHHGSGGGWPCVEFVVHEKELSWFHQQFDPELTLEEFKKEWTSIIDEPKEEEVQKYSSLQRKLKAQLEEQYEILELSKRAKEHAFEMAVERWPMISEVKAYYREMMKLVQISQYG